MSLNVYDFVKSQSKEFEKLKESVKLGGLRVRELNATETLKGLYLLIGDSERGDILNESANGQIFEKGTNKLVCAAQYRVYENVDLTVLNDALKSQPDRFEYDECGNKVNMYEFEPYPTCLEYAEDGTMIRVYNYKGVWYTATTRCIDGEYSYWEKRENSFKRLFEDVFGTDYSKLDEKLTYFFILRHPLNRLVVKHIEASLVFISTINNESLEEVFTSDLDFARSECIQIEEFSTRYSYTAEEIVDWADEESESVLVDKTIECVTNARENVNWTMEEISSFMAKSFDNDKKGIMFVKFDYKTGYYKRYLYETPMYRMFKELKGNVPNILERYLELYLKSYSESVMFKRLFDENISEFNNIELKLEYFVKDLLKTYIETHVRHAYKLDETHKYSRSLKQLHAIYRNSQTKENVKGVSIREPQVWEWVKKLSTRVLMTLLDIPVNHKYSKKVPKRILKRPVSISTQT